MLPRATQSVIASREAANSMGLSLLEHFRTPQATLVQAKDVAIVSVVPAHEVPVVV